jgi:hypothetical protein
MFSAFPFSHIMHILSHKNNLWFQGSGLLVVSDADGNLIFSNGLGWTLFAIGGLQKKIAVKSSSLGIVCRVLPAVILIPSHEAARSPEDSVWPV